MRPWAPALALCASCARTLAPPTPEAVFGPTLPARLALSLHTDEGDLACELEPRRAPHGAALFVALARGGFPWRDPRTGRVRTDALYREVPFHRVIPGVLAQTGCPLGNGFGHPGYRIPAEPQPEDAARLALPGALFFARYTPPPGRADPSPPPPGQVLGSQFGVGLVSMAHLAGQTTVLGRCEVSAALLRLGQRARAPFARLRDVEVAR